MLFEDVLRSPQAVDDVRGCPHTPTPSSEIFRIEAFVRPELRGQDPAAPPREFVKAPDERPKVRDIYVKQEDVITHRATPGCQRCASIIAGKVSTKPHTPENKDRFEVLSPRRTRRAADE